MKRIRQILAQPDQLNIGTKYLVQATVSQTRKTQRLFDERGSFFFEIIQEKRFQFGLWGEFGG